MSRVTAGNNRPFRTLGARRGCGAALIAMLVGIGGIGVAMPMAADASQVVTPLASGDFSGATASDVWFDPAAPNFACLTAGANTTQLPIPGCNNSSPDATGSGVLQFTSSSGNEVGSTFYQTALPTSQGLDVTFDTYQWNGSGADGISFDLTAADPSNPSPPPEPGPPGGSLGYSTNGSTNGIAHGYLGLGLDVYGNYANTTYQGSSCTPPTGLSSNTAYPEAVTVHGPGNGTNGYCILASTAQTAKKSSTGGSNNGTTSNLPNGALLDQQAATSRPSPVQVEVAINPSSGVTTAQVSGLSVPADSWLIAYLPYVGASPVSSWNTTDSLTGALPTTISSDPGYSSELASSDFPSSWINQATGIPYLLNFGWAASTGGSTEVHQVATLAGTSLNGPVPVLGATSANSQSDQVLPNSTTSFTLTAEVQSDASSNEAAESDPVTMTDTFPSGITPGTPTSSSPDWNCSGSSGQVVTCTYKPSSTIAAGTLLPSVNVPATVSSSASGSLRSVVRVSSLDGDPGTVTDATQVYPWSVTANAPSSGGPVTFSEAGLPPAADGNTVKILNGTTTLCSFVLGATTDSCSASTLAAGTQSQVTAELEAGNGYPTNDVAVPSFVVAKSPTTTTVAVSPAVPVAGEFASWIATVASSAQGTPTGTVAFSVGGATLANCSAVTVVAGTATCTASLSAGAVSVTATYSGDASFSGSSGSLAATVAQRVQTVVAATPPSPSPPPPPAPPSPPSPPGDVIVRFVAATPTSGTAIISWRPVIAPGDATVRYRVTAVPFDKTCVTSTTTCRIGGLRPGVAYRFVVIAETTSGTTISVSSSALGHEIAPHLVPNRAALVSESGRVPIQVTCQHAQCVGVADVTVARRVMRQGKQVGWRHLVLGTGSFRIPAGHRTTLRLVETALGRRLLPVQLHWWLARETRFHLTLTVKEIGQRTTNTPTYLTGRA